MSKLRKLLRNKVVGHAVVPVDDLVPNAKNWRLHPDRQASALAGSIDDVGFIRSITVNKTTGNVVDGHLRLALALESGVKELPVEYVELTEDEEKKALLMVDPIAELAEADKTKMLELFNEVNSDDDRVQAMMANLAKDEGLFYGDEGSTKEEEEIVPEQWLIMVTCESEEEQAELLSTFEEMGVKCRALIS